MALAQVCSSNGTRIRCTFSACQLGSPSPSASDATHDAAFLFPSLSARSPLAHSPRLRTTSVGRVSSTSFIKPRAAFSAHTEGLEFESKSRQLIRHYGATARSRRGINAANRGDRHKSAVAAAEGNGSSRGGPHEDPEESEGGEVQAKKSVQKNKEWDESLFADWDDADKSDLTAKGWSLDEPKVFYFAVANAESLICGGALLEEVLEDGLRRAKRAGRPRDVWLVMEPSFLSHPSLSLLKTALKPPTAAIVSTNGDWMLRVVRELLPQASIGKFYAPTLAIPNPFKSNLSPGDAVIGGGGVWH